MPWPLHEGPTYQKISPAGFAGFLIVVVVVVGFLSIFQIGDITTIIITVFVAALLCLVARATIIKRVRKSLEKRSLLSKEEALFDSAGQEEDPER
jgi:hypothetical protein